MGTDITIFAEKKNSDGNWELFDEPVANNETYNYPDLKQLPYQFYHDRNYSVFAILADIGNGRYSNELYVPIADRRGLPDDMSELGQTFYSDAGYWFGETWYYVEEIIEYDWKQSIQKNGFVAPDFAHLFKGNPLGFPREELRRLQNPDGNPGEARVTTGASRYMDGGVEVSWRETYREAVENLLESLRKYYSKKAREAVRVILWFSN